MFDVKFAVKLVSSVPSLSVEDPCLWVCRLFVGTETPSVSSCEPICATVSGELGVITGLVVSAVTSLSVEDSCRWVFVGTEPRPVLFFGSTTGLASIGEVEEPISLNFSTMEFTNLSASSRLTRPLFMQMRTKITQNSITFISKRHPAGRVPNKKT